MAISRFFVDTTKTQQSSGIFNEFVCGMIFDTSRRGNIFGSYPLAKEKYDGGKIQLLSSLDEVEASGITENGIMNGVPYYHLKHFFTLASKQQSMIPYLYVVFANCSSNFDVLNKMMHATKKKIFQFGIWTEQEIFMTEGNDRISPLLTKLSAVMFPYRSTFQRSDEYDQDVPFNVILNANVSISEYINTRFYLTDRDGARLKDHTGAYLYSDAVNLISEQFTYFNVPSVRGFDIPGLSIVLGQESSDEVHTMQSKNVRTCPVGCVGAVLGVLATCPVEYSIADRSRFSLKDVIPVAELGFGENYTPIRNLSYIRKNRFDSAGFIILTNEDGYENEVFLSSDMTLGKGDCNTLSKCRTLNKAHRVTRYALLQSVNGPIPLNPSTGKMSAASAVAIENAVIKELDTRMGVAGGLEGNAQLDSRSFKIPLEQDVINSDKITGELEITPGNHTESIVVAEEIITV